MGKWLGAIFRGRPWWMNALMVFCGYMAIVYVPWDLFWKPVARDEEVWLGILFTGWAAKWLAVPHWLVYAAGFNGFLHMRSWMWPWASVYVAQIAVGMLVWSVLYGQQGFWGWVIGAVALALFALLAGALWRARPLFQGASRSLRERYGDWALVTGASAGIGEAFARALAREGLSLVLTARREERLRALAEELGAQHGVETRVVAADLADAAGAERLAEAVADVPIGLLVNNAGAGYVGRFDKLDPERLRAMVNLNCVSPVVLTGRILPGMRARGRGGVIVTGSVAGRQPLPLHAVYSATKAFDLFFGEALSVELENEGIDVLVVEPGLTATEFQQVAGETVHGGEPPEKVVDLALASLGRRPSVVSGWLNWLLANLARIPPRSFTAHLAENVMGRQVPAEMR